MRDQAAVREPEAASPWLTESEMRAWRAMISTSVALIAVLDTELKSAHGLSMGDYEVLVHLSDAPAHQLRMTELASKLHLSPSGITRRIDGLVRDGLVERHQCPTDRRGSNAVLTDLGFARLRDAAPTHLAGVRRHFIDRLAPDQLDALADALDSVDISADSVADACVAACDDV